MKPREKYTLYGPTRLEGQELLAILLGSGVQGSSVFTVANTVQRLLQTKGSSITQDDLLRIKGIGPMKAMQIVSAFELAKRYFIQDTTRIESIDDVLTQVSAYRDKKQEYLLCLDLDGAKRLIQKRIVTVGLLNQSLVHPREVFADAIESRANSIILVHNHPSGTVTPSQEDITVTQRLEQASRILGIKIIDHIIVTKTDWWSFKCNEKHLHKDLKASLEK